MRRTALTVLALAGVLLLFAPAMLREVTYDEEQYVAAGILAQSLLPYRDFVYLQAPLYPFVLAALFRLTGGWFLLSARLLTFALSLGSAALLWRLLRRLGAGLPLAVTLMLACLCSPFLDPPFSNARNDALPLALLLGGLLLQVQARTGWERAATALLFGCAAEAKVSYVFAPLALGLHALAAPRRRLSPVLLGTALAAVPALLCWAATPEAFRFGLLDYHLTAPAEWYARQGRAAMLSWPVRGRTLLGWLVQAGNAPLMVLGFALGISAVLRRTGWPEPGGLLALLFVGALGFGAMPAPTWPMYYAAVPPLLACCVALLDRAAGSSGTVARRRAVLAALAALAAPMLLAKAEEAVGLVSFDKWVGVAAHRSALAVRAALPRPGPVATLYPTAVADANPVLPELSAGPFVFRSGAIYPPGLLRRLHALSPFTLAAALDVSPPAAIYAGLHAAAWAMPMDAALTAYAAARGWRVVLEDAEGGRLWRPVGADRADPAGTKGAP